MAFFRLRWLRRFIRNNTTRIPENKAELWRSRLSVAYMFFSWNALGIIIYLYSIGEFDQAAYYGLKSEVEKNKKPAVYYAELLGVEKAHVIQMKGFSKINEFDYGSNESK